MNQPKITCQCGFVSDAGAMFCAQCGARLNPISADGSGAPVPPGMPGIQNMPCGPGMQNAPWGPGTPQATASNAAGQDSTLPDITPDDKHLKFLVNTCDKTCGLPAGDRYSEEVLYADEAKGTYELHTYSRDCFGPELHRGYMVDADFAEGILSAIEEGKMNSLDEKKEIPICGGARILKFVDRNGKVTRLQAGEGKIRDAYRQISSMLRAGIVMERMIVTDYAKNWRKMTVCSQGMSAQDCYRFTLLHSNDGSYSLAATDGTIPGPMMGAMSGTMSGPMMGAMSGTMSGPMMGAMSGPMMGAMSGTMSGPMMGASPLSQTAEGCSADIPLPEDVCAAIDRIPLGMMFSARKNEAAAAAFPVMEGMCDGSSQNCSITYDDGISDSKIIDSNMMRKLLEVIRPYLQR